VVDCDSAISDSEFESESTTGCAAAPEDKPATTTGAGTVDTEGVGAVGAVPAVLSTVAVGGAMWALVVATLGSLATDSPVS